MAFIYGTNLNDTLTQSTGHDMILCLGGNYLRRHYEIIDDVGYEYNLLASLFKERGDSTLATATDNRKMTHQEKLDAQLKIRQVIPSFDYASLVAQVVDRESMKLRFYQTDVGYEKNQLFRIIKGTNQDDIITKFINESYHIGNEYVMQLNPHKFESVPEYAVMECTRLIQAA